ncbi:MAG: hypothetical protein LBV12_10555 [Puniceicoccales bacterium]|jgi:membrane-bound ClpP family serine protease|nr:hypothetical protein [Puniceicoccales bacterium]
MFPLVFAEAATEAGALAEKSGMGTAALLIFLGLVLIGAEIFLPGMICGILGTLLVIGGVGMAFYTEGMMAGVLAMSVVFVAMLVGFWFYVKVLPKTRMGKKIFLDATIEGAGAEAPGDDTLIGQQGAALTVLAPSGLVRVDGRQYEAVSRDGFLEKGEGIVVVGRETLRLVVGKTK